MSELLLKPWTGKNRTAYDRLYDLDRVVEAYKRCRVLQFFILDNSYINNNEVICSVCGKRIFENDGNRGQYYPKRKKAIVMHYTCAWGVTLESIAQLGRKVYG